MVTEKNEALRTGRTPVGQIGGEGSADILGHREDPFARRFAGPNQHGTPRPVQIVQRNAEYLSRTQAQPSQQKKHGPVAFIQSIVGRT
jgi:hypothetical protein